MSIDSHYCRGSDCSQFHLPERIFCENCDKADGGEYKCQNCGNICLDNSLFCEKHIFVKLSSSFQDELMQEIKNMMQEIKSMKTTMQEIDTLKAMMVRMSDHFDILVSRLDLLEKQ